MWRKQGKSKYISDGGKDTLCFSLFMALFTSGYKGLLCALRALKPCSSAYYTMIAGTVAGTSLIIDSNPSRRIMIALYIATRTGHYFARYAWKCYIKRVYYKARPKTDFGVKKIELVLSPQPLKARGNHLEGHVPDRRVQLMSSDSGDAEEVLNSQKEINLNDSAVHLPLSKEPAQTAKQRAFLHQVMAVTIMTVSSSIILYAFVVDQSTLTKPYLSFLLTHSGIKDIEPKQSLGYLKAIGSVVNHCPSNPDEKFMMTLDGRENPDFVRTAEALPFMKSMTQFPHHFVMCALQHPRHTSCRRGMLSAIRSELIQSLKLYGPLNLILMLIFNPKKIVKAPFNSVIRFVRGTIRSCLFLTCYVAAAWSLPCFFRNMFRTDQPWMYKWNGVIAGLMVLIEHPSRRLELGMYCLPRALETLFKMYARKGWIRPIPFGEVGLFSLCMGVLMSLYQYESDCIHEGTLKVMTRLFGVN